MPLKPYKGKKLQGIRLFANGATQKEVADAVGVHWRTVYRWRKEAEFQEAVLKEAYGLLKQKLPNVYKVMQDEALNGSHQHLKILMDHIHRMEELHNGLQSAQISFTWQRKDK